MSLPPVHHVSEHAPTTRPVYTAALAVAAPYQLVQARHGWILANPHDFFLGRAMIEYGEYGEIESQFLLGLLSVRAGKVVEIGANVGLHTIPMAKALAQARREMIVFEPQQFLFQNLCANLALNGITNVTAWPLACGNKNEQVYFPLPDYLNNGNFGGVSVSNQASNGGVAVTCVRLDETIGQARVGLLKIDVEGYELFALQGAEQTLMTSRPIVYVENDRVEKSQALIEWLWAHNYQLFWHISPLFNPDNYFKAAQNIYGKLASFNMLGVPRELNIAVEGLQEITNAALHPFL